MLSTGSPAIGYEDRGHGAPVVLLHPFPFARGLWAGLAEALATHHRVITVDARGFGESPLATPYAISDLADDLAALLGALGVERVILVGMSMGGYTALAFAARHPDRLAALALADTRAAADSPAARDARGSAIEAIRRGGPEAYLVGSLPRLLSPAAPPALATSLRAQAETRPASLVAALEAMRERPDRTGELAAIRCPALLVCGDADQVVPTSEMGAMANLIPGATFAIIPAAGHLCHVEAFEAFERVLATFLAGLRAAFPAPSRPPASGKRPS